MINVQETVFIVGTSWRRVNMKKIFKTNKLVPSNRRKNNEVYTSNYTRYFITSYETESV